MARQGFSLLLQFYLLLLLVRPLDPSSHPERDTGTSGQLPEEMELQDTDPEPMLMVDVVLALWTCLLVVLLITGIVLGCGLGRRFWRCWTEEKRQSPSAHAGPCCCTGHGCPRNVIQLLGHNRAMLRLSPQPSAEAQSQESS
ncbi:hypothetical protein HGM15179_012183 [Zosterops borbonicus]|uniref:Uncharacterized protein n=1 Tax=Zosterops borbonicus TaxID=364589 RepID=A0A8K1GBK3_9PASS|nr:hypothetical protein HGM15179_012183 [Zosterops borbonicus]